MFVGPLSRCDKLYYVPFMTTTESQVHTCNHNISISAPAFSISFFSSRCIISRTENVFIYIWKNKRFELNRFEHFNSVLSRQKLSSRAIR